MDSGWRSELKDTLSRLESALKTVDSEYEKKKEALELSHKSKREELQQFIEGLQAALGENRQAEVTSETTPEEEDQTDLSLTGRELSTVIHSNGSGKESPDEPSEQASTATERFSTRREIEKLLPEFAPDQDITQSEIRGELERRFPQHKDSFKAASVSSALRRIANAGELVRIAEGKGSEPNLYRLPGHDDKDGNQEELSELGG